MRCVKPGCGINRAIDYSNKLCSEARFALFKHKRENQNRNERVGFSI